MTAIHPATNQLAARIGGDLGQLVSAAFDHYPAWKPGAGSTTSQAMALRATLSGPGAAVTSEAWVTLAYQALRRWNAFRGTRITLAQWRAAIGAAVPHLLKLGSTTIENYLPSAADALYEAFDAFVASYPAANPWVPASKSLHFLLPVWALTGCRVL